MKYQVQASTPIGGLNWRVELLAQDLEEVGQQLAGCPMAQAAHYFWIMDDAGKLVATIKLNKSVTADIRPK